jgi:3-methyl-2-oxobutanoate hydroxymethyltransferase
MGAGPVADGQYLFSSDVLGYSEWWTPRHSKQYRDFRDEFTRLQAERVAAFEEFRADCESGVYPGADHCVPVADEVVEEFVDFLDQQG